MQRFIATSKSLFLGSLPSLVTPIVRAIKITAGGSQYSIQWTHIHTITLLRRLTQQSSYTPWRFSTLINLRKVLIHKVLAARLSAPFYQMECCSHQSEDAKGKYPQEFPGIDQLIWSRFITVAQARSVYI